MGQKFARLGSPDPRLCPWSSVDFRFQSQLEALKKANALSCRVKLVPITLVLHVLEFTFHLYPSAQERQPVVNMFYLTFYSCLRPTSEYTGSTTDGQAFTIDGLTAMEVY